MAMSAVCPQCQATVNIDDDAELGDRVECASCGAILELTSLKPPRLEAVEDDMD